MIDSRRHSRLVGLLQEDGDVALDVRVSQDPVDARTTIRILIEHRLDEFNQLSAVELWHRRHLGGTAGGNKLLLHATHYASRNL